MSARPAQPHLSNPGRVRIDPGGAGRNVAENLTRLGLNVKLLAAVDMNPLAEWMISQTAQAGVDVSAVVRVSGRGNYYVAIESGGVLEWAVSEMAAAEALTPGDVEAHAGLFRAADAVVVDANLQPATIRRAVELTAGRPLCLLPVSVAKCRRMLDTLSQATLVVLTAAEASTLAGIPMHTEADAVNGARSMRARGAVVITMGDRGAGWIDAGVTWQTAPPSTVVDPTGAGDAVAAVAVYGVITGLRADAALRLALAAASMTATVEGSTHPGLSLEALHDYARLA